MEEFRTGGIQIGFQPIKTASKRKIIPKCRLYHCDSLLSNARSSSEWVTYGKRGQMSQVAVQKLAACELIYR
jgi:hypothetical protein